MLLDFRRQRLKWHRSTKPECVVGLTLSLTKVEDRSVSFKNLIDFVARCLESALTLGTRDMHIHLAPDPIEDFLARFAKLSLYKDTIAIDTRGMIDNQDICCHRKSDFTQWMR